MTRSLAWLHPLVALLLVIASTPASWAIPKMEYVKVKDRFGKTVKLSRLVLGTDHMAQANWNRDGQPEATYEEVKDFLRKALKLGINFIDTSPIYVGSIEYKIGRAVSELREEIKKPGFYKDETLNPDREIYVLSKGGFPADLSWAKKLPPGTHSPELLAELEKQGILIPDTVPDPDGSIPLRETVPVGTYASRLYGTKEQIIERVAEELGYTRGNLGEPGPTVYLMHRDDGDAVGFVRVGRLQVPVEIIMEALSDPRIAKHFRFLGWSNWTTERVNQSLQVASARPDLVAPTFNSPYFSLLVMYRAIHALGIQATHEQLMDPDFQKGIFFMPYSPLGGFAIFDRLPGKAWENAREEARRLAAKGGLWQNVYEAIFTPENEKRIKGAEIFLAAYNRKHRKAYTIDQLLNAYALAHTRMDFLTVGPINEEQLNRTFEALELSKHLTPQDLDTLHLGLCAEFLEPNAAKALVTVL